MGGPGLSHFRVVHPGPPATRDRLSHARRLRSVGLLTVEQQNLLVLTVVQQMTSTAQFLRLQRWFGTNHDGLALSDNILRSTCRITIPNPQEVEAAPNPFLWVVTTPQPDAFAKQPYVPENAPFSVQGWATCCDPSKVQPAEADGWMLGSSESSSSQADWLWADLLDLPFGVLQ